VAACASSFGISRAPAAAPSAAATTAADTAVPTLPTEQFTLPNGLTVLVHEDRRSPVVAVDLLYHVGSKDEMPGKNGSPTWWST
jgi:zinc protease